MFVYFGIIACVVISGSNAQNRCVHGSCISLELCEPLLRLLESYPPPLNHEIESLKKWRCAFDTITRVPKVCCPNDSQITSPKSSTVVPEPPDVANHPNLRLINSPDCGPSISTKMFPGSLTTWDDFPWMALLAYKTDGSDSPVFKCGGTLINKRYVLTAAHCVSGDKLSGVRIGEHNLGQKIDCNRADKFSLYCANEHQDFLVESVHVHEEYQEVNQRNDIALIRINTDAVFGPSVTTSCLPVGDATTPKSARGLVTGWGVTEAGVRNQTMLRGNMATIPNEECARIYENIGLELSYKQFCAKGQTEKQSCVGDSGGPFQGPGRENGVHYFQYGVSSYGHQHCRTKGTIVYTKVAYYVKWILDTITD